MTIDPRRPEYRVEPKRPGVTGKLMPRYTAAQPIKKTPFGVIFGWLKALGRQIAKLLRPLTQLFAKHPRFSMLVIVLIIGFVCLYIWVNGAIHTNDSQTTATDTQEDLGSASLSKGKPTFDTISPASLNIEQKGGWTRISPPSREPVYAYTDSIGQIPIIVSEQRLPQKLQGDVDQNISDLASSYAANEKLKTGDTTVYIGTSAKGPQSVIFVKNNLLVLIKSDSAIPEKAWKTYISSMN